METTSNKMSDLLQNYELLFLVGLGIIMLIYCIATILLTIGWKQIQVFEFITPTEKAFISLIVPVRNEEENLLNLLQDLQSQSNQNFELILVNDASTDKTVEIAECFKLTAIFPITILHSNRNQNSSPKKTAISQGIAVAKGKLITTTDGDCRVGMHWLRDIHSFYQAKKPKLISAGVTFQNEKKWFEKIQTVEFMSLIGAGGVSMNWGKPNMCNGANLTYEKNAFDAVGGFSGSEQLASGDDEFLMHKIFKTFPLDVKFLKSESSIVKTNAQSNFLSFFQQRKRWASKWNHYENFSAVLTALFVYAVHLASVLLWVGLCFFSSWRVEFGLLIAAKIVCEFFYLRAILVSHQQTDKIKWIPITQIFHSAYVVLIGLFGKLGGYSWKGRKLK
jgi:cellulose synthase/poly-beta-1,6-N-acetylglucosamine synthase-like glycosyltransferase